MITIHQCRQLSEEWENLRAGKLTGSKIADVICSDAVAKLELTTISPQEATEKIGKATKQQEVYDLLKEANAPLSCKDLNASGVKGLLDKGIAAKVDNKNALRFSSKLQDRLLRLIVERPEFALSKAELGDPLPTFAMERGIEIEPLARLEFEMTMCLDVKQVGFVTNDRLPHVGCSPDGLIYEAGDLKSGLEIKCPLPHTHLKYLIGGVLPDEYKAQVHLSMAVCEVESWYFMSYHPHDNLPTFITKVYRDSYTDNLKALLKQFNTKLMEQLEALRNID